jgi:outer membrane immunogenic protein
MNKLIIAVAGSAAAFVIGPALAAELPVKAPPAPAPVVTWTGGYLGVGIGEQWGSTRWTTTCFASLPPFSSPGAFGSCDNPDPAVNVIDSSSPHTFKTTSLRGTMYGGFNLQTNNWVWGMEVQFGIGNGRRTFDGIPGCSAYSALPPVTPGTPNTNCYGNGENTQVALDYDGSMRARAGYLLTPNILAYGTAGLAFQTLRSSATCAIDGATFFYCLTPAVSFAHETMFGWTGGGGLEWRYRQYVFRGEYRYSDYGHTDVSYFQPEWTLGQGIHTRLHTTTQMAYFGMSYLWGPLGSETGGGGGGGRGGGGGSGEEVQ